MIGVFCCWDGLFSWFFWSLRSVEFFLDCMLDECYEVVEWIIDGFVGILVLLLFDDG